MNKIFNYLLKNSKRPWSLYLLQKIMNNKISFNSAHKFKFLELSDKRVRIQTPFIRTNKNHLGGIHACAIATAGEYAAGLTLIKNFDLYSYRVIMGELKVEYFKQAVGPITAIAELTTELRKKMREDLSLEFKSSFELVTNIENSQGERVATVMTKWQLKDWKKVSFKA